MKKFGLFISMNANLLLRHAHRLRGWWLASDLQPRWDELRMKYVETGVFVSVLCGRQAPPR